MNLSVFIGLRYTGAQRNNQLVSFISGISIVGIVVSVALLVVVLSVMNGFDKELRERILSVLPQGAIYHSTGVEDWQALRSHLNSQRGIADSAPFVQLAGMLSYKREVGSVLLYGIDPKYQTKVSSLGQYLEKPMDELLQDKSILLGVELANKLGLEEGKHVRVIIPQSESMSATPIIERFTISGLIRTGTEADQHFALINLSAAQALAKSNGRVTGMWLKVDNLFEAPYTVYNAVRSLPRGYSSTDWTRSQGNLYQAIQMSKKMVGLLLFLIIGIAAFNVVSTLVMVTVDKQSDIAILRTLGATSGRIMRIFMVQGTLIGVIGTAVGLGLGILLASFVQEFVAWLEQLIGFQFLQSDVYPISFVPEEIRLLDLLAIGSTSLALSFLATLYPAWRASRIKPAEALRYEV
ncbi:lipoprotein-releasing ABC transporter permease subunit [Aurantivibrio plasticivorans]